MDFRIAEIRAQADPVEESLMVETGAEHGLRVVEVVERYGKCLELISMDPHFEDITVGLYMKNDVLTVWTYSRKNGVKERIRRIRDQLVNLGGLVAVEDTNDQARPSCDSLHTRPLKFLLAQAVEKAPDYSHPDGPLSIQDTKTDLTLNVEGSAQDERWVYRISAEGDPDKISWRLPAVQAGFVRYGEMEKVEENTVAFECGQRHDELLRLLLPYSRNISAVETMLEESALRGQLTTGTAGFSPM